MHTAAPQSRIRAHSDASSDRSINGPAVPSVQTRWAKRIAYLEQSHSWRPASTPSPDLVGAVLLAETELASDGVPVAALSRPPHAAPPSPPRSMAARLLKRTVWLRRTTAWLTGANTSSSQHGVTEKDRRQLDGEKMGMRYEKL